MKKLSKISTITKRSWSANPSKYEAERDQNIGFILASKPLMNVTVKVSNRPF